MKPAKTRAGKKFLEDRAPKIIENRKKSLFIKGHKFPQQMTEVWNDLALFRHGEIVKFQRENDIFPFDNVRDIENFCQKNDCSLFTFFTHNKKRPYDIIFGRLFNGEVMDMFEFGIINQIEHSKIPSPHIDAGVVPALIFQGELWDTELAPLRSYFMDYFVGDLKGQIDTIQVSHAIVLTAVEEEHKILFRHYLVEQEKGATKMTKVAPSFDLVRRREQIADNDMLESAMVKAPTEKKKKNIKKDALGREIGRVFVGRNDVSKLKLKKFDGLNKKPKTDEKK